MRINATVHSIVRTKRPAEVQHGDQTIIADIPVLTVELVSDDPDQSNFTIHAPPDHEKMFRRGAPVTITIAPRNEEPAK